MKHFVPTRALRNIALSIVIAAGAFAATAASAQGTSTSSYEKLQSGGLLVVAEWTVKPDQVEKVSELLGQYLPQAQKDPGVKLFLISRGKDKPNQFLFYELFNDDAAYAKHQEREYFKSLIVGQALPLVDNRVRSQYSLIK